MVAMCDRAWQFIKRHSTVPGAVVVFAATYILMLAVNAGDAGANWVQAIGSIIAIVAAGYFPIWHSKVERKNHQQRLLELMRVLSDDSAEALWLLSNSFVMPEFEVEWMRQYLQNHRDRDWEPLLNGLSQVPVAEIPPERVSELGRIRDAVQFGASVATMLPKWIDEGSSHPKVLETLRAKRDLLMLIRGGLPSPSGVVERQVDAQQRGQRHEQFVGADSISDFSVYKRFHYYRCEPGQVPDCVQVQIVAPYGDSHPTTFVIEAPEGGWIDIYHAQREIRARAQDCIDQIIEHEMAGSL